MANKYRVTFADSGVIFLDSKDKAIDTNEHQYAKHVPLETALMEAKREVSARGSLTDASMSMVCEILQSGLGKLSAYTGKTAIGHSLDKGMKTIVRECETALLKPVFVAEFTRKSSAKDKTSLDFQGIVEKAWSEFIGEMAKGGIYGQCKSASTQYLAYFGKLPCVYNADGTPDTNKLLRPSTILKLIANERQAENPKAKLVSLLEAVRDYLKTEENLTEKDAIAGYLIAHDIDATLKGIRDKYAEQATNKAHAVPPIPDASAKVIDGAMAMAKQIDAKQAKKNKGQISPKDVPALI